MKRIWPSNERGRVVLLMAVYLLASIAGWAGDAHAQLATTMDLPGTDRARVLAGRDSELTGPAGPLPGYVLEQTWAGSTHGAAGANNLFVAPDGRVWLLDVSAEEAVVLNDAGMVVGRTPVPDDTLDFAVAPDNGLFVGRWSARPLLSAVTRLDPSGAEIWSRDCDCATGSGVAMATGRAWLTKPTARTLTWFGTADGRVSGELQPPGAEAGFPADVTSAPDGTLFATDLIEGAVYSWPPPYLPRDVLRWDTAELSGPFRIGAGAQDDGELVVAVLFSDGLVRAYRADGAPVARFYVPGEPMDIGVGADARIYVLDETERDVMVYAPGAPPTPTPGPVDPPLTPRSCQIRGTRTLQPGRVEVCDTVVVRLQLDAVCPPGAVPGSDIALLIDRSGSMIRGNQMEAARQAARRFLAGLDLTRHQVAIVSFNHGPVLEHALSRDATSLSATLDAIRPSGDTNMAGAITLAAQHLAVAGRRDALPVMVVLSDGEPTIPRVPEANIAALVAAERARSRRAYIFTIGLGVFVDSRLLEAIASSPGDFYYAPSPEALAGIYDRIAQEIRSLSLTDLIVEDSLDASFVRHVAGSGLPVPLVVGDTLLWNKPALPGGGMTITYTVQTLATGRMPVGRARVGYVDADGTRRTYSFVEPRLEVGAATSPLSRPEAVALPARLAEFSLPAAAYVEECPGDTWTLRITVFPDSVGVGRYDCPGCNGVWDGGDAARPLRGPAVVEVRAQGGAALWSGEVAPGPSGRATAHVFLCAPPPYEVALVSTPPGTVSCPNSPPLVTVGATANRRSAAVSFALWGGCGIGPTPTPGLPVACVEPELVR